jgi:hypothetical protein
LFVLASALSVALVFAALAVFAAEARASEASFDRNPPNAVLMKGDTAIQKGLGGSFCWSYWNEAKDYWEGVCADVAYAKKTDLYPRQAVLVPAGSTLRIRLYKPQRPEAVQLVQGFKNNPQAFFGWGRPLPKNLRRVERNGKTVAWDIVFRVVRPERHRYLGVEVVWEQVPGTHASYGDAAYTFHVKTRA